MGLNCKCIKTEYQSGSEGVGSEGMRFHSNIIIVFILFGFSIAVSGVSAGAASLASGLRETVGARLRARLRVGLRARLRVGRGEDEDEGVRVWEDEEGVTG